MSSYTTLYQNGVSGMNSIPALHTIISHHNAQKVKAYALQILWTISMQKPLIFDTGYKPHTTHLASVVKVITKQYLSVLFVFYRHNSNFLTLSMLVHCQSKAQIK